MGDYIISLLYSSLSCYGLEGINFLKYIDFHQMSLVLLTVNTMANFVMDHIINSYFRRVKNLLKHFSPPILRLLSKAGNYFRM